MMELQFQGFVESRGFGIQRLSLFLFGFFQVCGFGEVILFFVRTWRFLAGGSAVQLTLFLESVWRGLVFRRVYAGYLNFLVVYGLALSLSYMGSSWVELQLLSWRLELGLFCVFVFGFRGLESRLSRAVFDRQLVSVVFTLVQIFRRNWCSRFNITFQSIRLRLFFL